MRACNTINGIQACINASAEGSHAACVALVSLASLLGKTGWEEQLQPLDNVDRQEMAEGEEEVELLEEMACVLQYLEWQEGWWRMRGLCLGWEGIPEANTEGLHAYAEHQAAL